MLPRVRLPGAANAEPGVEGVDGRPCDPGRERDRGRRPGQRDVRVELVVRPLVRRAPGSRPPRAVWVGVDPDFVGGVRRAGSSNEEVAAGVGGDAIDLGCRPGTARIATSAMPGLAGSWRPLSFVSSNTPVAGLDVPTRGDGLEVAESVGAAERVEVERRVDLGRESPPPRPCWSRRVGVGVEEREDAAREGGHRVVPGRGDGLEPGHLGQAAGDHFLDEVARVLEVELAAAGPCRSPPRPWSRRSRFRRTPAARPFRSGRPQDVARRR